VGLILDTSVLVAHERRRASVGDILRHARSAHGEDVVGISTVTAVELTHGIHRARTIEDQVKRVSFANEVFHDLVLYPLTLEIAELAGKIEGEQAAIGIGIPFPDLLIGATAVYPGFDVAIHNEKHFRLIPGLRIVKL
jgi:tRNA(fMet)-specific endonuclease VapC